MAAEDTNPTNRRRFHCRSSAGGNINNETSVYSRSSRRGLKNIRTTINNAKRRATVVIGSGGNGDAEISTKTSCSNHQRTPPRRSFSDEYHQYYGNEYDYDYDDGEASANGDAALGIRKDVPSGGVKLVIHIPSDEAKDAAANNPCSSVEKAGRPRRRDQLLTKSKSKMTLDELLSSHHHRRQQQQQHKRRKQKLQQPRRCRRQQRMMMMASDRKGTNINRCRELRKSLSYGQMQDLTQSFHMTDLMDLKRSLHGLQQERKRTRNVPVGVKQKQQESLSHTGEKERQELAEKLSFMFENAIQQQQQPQQLREVQQDHQTHRKLPIHDQIRQLILGLSLDEMTTIVQHLEDCHQTTTNNNGVRWELLQSILDPSETVKWEDILNNEKNGGRQNHHQQQQQHEYEDEEEEIEIISYYEEVEEESWIYEEEIEEDENDDDDDAISSSSSWLMSDDGIEPPGKFPDNGYDPTADDETDNSGLSLCADTEPCDSSITLDDFWTFDDSFAVETAHDQQRIVVVEVGDDFVEQGEGKTDYEEVVVEESVVQEEEEESLYVEESVYNDESFYLEESVHTTQSTALADKLQPQHRMLHQQNKMLSSQPLRVNNDKKAILLYGGHSDEESEEEEDLLVMLPPPVAAVEPEEPIKEMKAATAAMSQKSAPMVVHTESKVLTALKQQSPPQVPTKIDGRKSCSGSHEVGAPLIRPLQQQQNPAPSQQKAALWSKPLEKQIGAPLGTGPSKSRQQKLILGKAKVLPENSIEPIKKDNEKEEKTESKMVVRAARPTPVEINKKKPTEKLGDRDNNNKNKQLQASTHAVAAESVRRQSCPVALKNRSPTPQEEESFKASKPKKRVSALVAIWERKSSN